MTTHDTTATTLEETIDRVIFLLDIGNYTDAAPLLYAINGGALEPWRDLLRLLTAEQRVKAAQEYAKHFAQVTGQHLTPFFFVRNWEAVAAHCEWESYLGRNYFQEAA